MKPLKWIRRILVFVLLLSLTPIHTQAEQNVLRVGYMDYDGFIVEQIDGSYIGYGAEYLAALSDYTGYTYEYVYGEWSDLLEQLKNGEIDLLCTAQKTDEREEIYDFSNYPIGYTQGILYGNADTDLGYEDYLAFNGLTVGMMENTAMRPLFEGYMEHHGFQATIVEMSSETLLQTALENHEVDAICSESLANHKGLSLLAEFGADAFYLMGTKNSPYMKEINFALQEVKSDPDYEANLYHKYYDNSSAATTLTFTTEEKQYIANCDVLEVGLHADRLPFSIYDSKTGEITGILPDLLDAISESTGLKFHYIPLYPGIKTVDAMASGDFDFICGIERDNFITSETLVPTTAVLESSIVPVGKYGAKLNLQEPLKAAIPQSFQALQKNLEMNYPNFELQYYKTNRECLDAVNQGEADIFIQNTHILSILLQEPQYDSLETIPTEIMTEHTAMVVNRDDPILLSILNKGIRNLDEATIQTSLIEHTFADPYQFTTADFLYKFKTQIILGVIAFLLIIAALIAVILTRKRSANKLEKKNQQLRDAVASADRANTAKSQFLSRMSHEIRTPMNAIVGLTTIARTHLNEPDKMTDYLTKIDTSSKVLLNIINDVLDMSSIESGKMKIAHEDFDIKTILTGISTIYYPQCESKGIAFTLDSDLEHEAYTGDSLRINQILMNLVSNAYKFTSAGGAIKISAQETSHRDRTAFVRFKVADTGVGISEEMQNRLFKPFEQENASTAKKNGGSGLGLSIAKNLVDLMHGAIKVDSIKGKGTTFTVDLPLEIADDNSVLDNHSLENLRILVIDDDSSAREYAGIVLQRIGAKYETASSGVEALEKIEKAFQEEHPYDVCLIDWKMPDMDGIEVTKRIRALEKQRTLIIIVSAYDLNEVTDIAKDAGADHFVSKPLFQSTLFNVLNNLTHGQIKKVTTEPENYDFGGATLLLAEDNDLNAEIASDLLEMVNMNVVRAEDGEKALHLFEASKPKDFCMILMDVQMPILNGYEATKAIRQLDREDAKTISIYAMTANAFTEDVSEALSSGMNGHIAKPIDTKILYATIQKALSQSTNA